MSSSREPSGAAGATAGAASAANAAAHSAIVIVPAAMPTGPSSSMYPRSRHVLRSRMRVSQRSRKRCEGGTSRCGRGIGAPSTSAARCRSVSAPQRQIIIVIARSGIPIVRIARLTPTASSVISVVSQAMPSGTPADTYTKSAQPRDREKRDSADVMGQTVLPLGRAFRPEAP